MSLLSHLFMLASLLKVSCTFSYTVNKDESVWTTINNID